MKYTRPYLNTLAILALVMQIMAQITPLWLKEQNGFTIQICAGQDVRTITMDEQGNKRPARPEIPKESCSFCLAAGHYTHFIKADPVVIAIRPEPWESETKRQKEPLKSHTSLLAHRPRGPPALS